MAARRHAVTHHAIVRWLDRAGGMALDVDEAREAVAAEFRIKPKAVSDIQVIRRLEATMPGFSRALVAKRILNQGGRIAIEMGAASVHVDGLTFCINSEGRICTVITGRHAYTKAREQWRAQCSV